MSRIVPVVFLSALALVACESKETPSPDPAPAAGEGAEANADPKPEPEKADDAEGEDASAEAEANEDDATKDAAAKEDGADDDAKDEHKAKTAGVEPAPATPTPTAKTAEKAKPTGPVVGKQASVTASAQADPGYHCNEAYPHKFVTKGGSNVSYPVERPKGACAGDTTVAVSVPYIPQAAGPGTVAGTLRYGICDDGGTNCVIKKRPLTLSFTASAP